VKDTIIYIVLVLLGAGVGAGLVWLYQSALRRKAERMATAEARLILERAKREAERTLAEAELKSKEKLLSREQALEKEWKGKRKELGRQESELASKELAVEKGQQALKDRQREVVSREQRVQQREEIVDREKHDAEALLKSHRSKLEEIAGLTAAEAKVELMRQMEYDARREATRIIKKIEENARDRAKNLARIITTQAIEKIVPYQPPEGTVSVVHLPSEEMKGRVIGREGRNIRAFERVTGVDVIVDDTPEIIMLACHSPIRRMTAQKALEKLVEDGRIHPGRIEEYVDKAREELDQYLMEQGREALFHLGIPDMHERLAHMVGQMKLRMSFGQNLLEHSVEVAKVSMYMAQAVDANVGVVKRAGILHEIGHLEEHPDDVHPTMLSAQLAKRYGESPAVVACIAHLHPDHPSTSPEAHLLEAAENLALSAPGLHKEGLERYIQHMEFVEKMVMGFKGVRKVYAMKAGRELLVLVDTEAVDDEYTIWLAKDISERLEHEVRFSGQVKVQVVRETRVTDYAT
jgi:ribonucrease Y